MMRQVVISLVLIISGLANANTIDPVKAYNEKKYELAIEGFKEHKNLKDKYFYMGIMHWLGRGVELDKNKGLGFWADGWKAGDERSGVTLGISLMQQNADAGISVFEEVAATGNKDAQYELGKIYYKKNSKYYNLEKAFKNFTGAAEKGRAGAQANLGLMYYYGEGVEKDLELSEKWYRKAAMAGFKNAKYALGVLLLNKKETDEALKWLEGSGMDDHMGAIMALADYHQQNSNFDKSIFWFEKARGLGNQDVTLPLGILKYESDDEIDKAEGLKMIAKCTVQGDKSCMNVMNRIWFAKKNRERIGNYMKEKFKK